MLWHTETTDSIPATPLLSVAAGCQVAGGQGWVSGPSGRTASTAASCERVDQSHGGTSLLPNLGDRHARRTVTHPLSTRRMLLFVDNKIKCTPPINSSPWIEAHMGTLRGLVRSRTLTRRVDCARPSSTLWPNRATRRPVRRRSACARGSAERWSMRASALRMRCSMNSCARNSSSRSLAARTTVSPACSGY